MSTSTYSERVQRAYFTAAAEIYDAASAVLNDCTEPAEFTGRTYEWARDLAASKARKAQALKELALEETVVVRAPVKFNRAQARYSEAVDRHLRLRKEYELAARRDALARLAFTETVSSGRETWKATG